MGTEKSTLAIEIGRRIAERRKQLGLTQAQAAESWFDPAVFRQR